MVAEYLHDEAIGDGVYLLYKTPKGNYVHVFQDKHSIYNIFLTMEAFMQYIEGQLECERVCLDPEWDDEGGTGEIDVVANYLGGF